jgi:hypothetical protein
MSAIYTATATHEGLNFTGSGVTDDEAVQASMKALTACWSINTNRAVLVVRLGDQVQYTTTAGKYELATR